MFSEELMLKIYSDERFTRHSVKAQTDILKVIEEKIDELEQENKRSGFDVSESRF